MKQNVAKTRMMQGHRRSTIVSTRSWLRMLLAGLVSALALAASGCDAFAAGSSSSSSSSLPASSSRAAAAAATTNAKSSTALNGLFGDTGESSSSVGGVLGNLFGGQQAGGPKPLIDLPANDVKIGALRFLLQIYLVGEQNKPEPKSWMTRQGNEGDLQVYYSDGTGMLSIGFQEYGITVTRNGAKPSLQYVLQESVLLHGVLDELENVAFGVEDIEEEKRLLRLKDADAISKARETLPARKA